MLNYDHRNCEDLLFSGIYFVLHVLVILHFCLYFDSLVYSSMVAKDFINSYYLTKSTGDSSNKRYVGRI